MNAIKSTMQSIRQIDLDEVLAYQTFKIVKVKDRRLGLLHMLFTAFIIGYMAYDIVANQKYLKKEAPVAGYTRMTLRASDNASEIPPYCSSSEVTGCLFLNADQVLDPNDQFFITTRITVEELQVPDGCDARAPRTAECTPQISARTAFFTAGVDDMTLMLVHTVRGDVTGLTRTNRYLRGQLLDLDGNVVQEWAPSNSTDPTDESFRRPAGVPGDIMTVSTLLRAVGVSSLDNAGSGAESLRYAGLVIVILVEYDNRMSDINEIKYKYRPTLIADTDAKSIQTVDASAQWNRHGARLQLVQTGEIGHFEFLALLVNVVASIALFKVASTFVEVLMLRVLPQRAFYNQYKFQSTEDFSDIRDNLKADRQSQVGKETGPQRTSLRAGQRRSRVSHDASSTNAEGGLMFAENAEQDVALQVQSG